MRIVDRGRVHATPVRSRGNRLAASRRAGRAGAHVRPAATERRGAGAIQRSARLASRRVRRRHVAARVRGSGVGVGGRSARPGGAAAPARARCDGRSQAEKKETKGAESHGAEAKHFMCRRLGAGFGAPRARTARGAARPEPRRRDQARATWHTFRRAGKSLSASPPCRAPIELPRPIAPGNRFRTRTGFGF